MHHRRRRASAHPGRPGGRRTLALANKESLIIGGAVVTSAAKPGQIVPVDSEHSALAQCLRGGRRTRCESLSSPPAADRSADVARRNCASVTPRGGDGAPNLGHGPDGHDELVNPGQQGPRGDRGTPTLRHPVRRHRGGRAPAVDHPLDGRVPRRVHVGAGRRRPTCGCRSASRSAGPTGSRTPRRPSTGAAPSRGSSSPGRRRLSPFGLAIEAGRSGGVRPAVYNAANEIAVQAFWDGRLGYLGIVDTVAAVLADRDVPSPMGHLTVDDVLAADAWARGRAADLVAATGTAGGARQG